MSKLRIVSDIFVQSNLNNFRNIQITHKNKYSEVTFSIDQTRLLANGIFFINQYHQNYITPIVTNATILDSKNINESFFYLGDFIQKKINEKIMSDTILSTNNNISNVKINLVEFNNITESYGIIQVLRVTIRFGGIATNL